MGCDVREPAHTYSNAERWNCIQYETKKAAQFKSIDDSRQREALARRNK